MEIPLSRNVAKSNNYSSWPGGSNNFQPSWNYNVWQKQHCVLTRWDLFRWRVSLLMDRCLRGETERLARSPDLNPWDFFIWGLLKSVVSATVPASIQDLINRSQEGTVSHYNDVSYFLGAWSHPTPRVKFWKFYKWAKVGESCDFGETLVIKIHRHKSPKMLKKFNGVGASYFPAIYLPFSAATLIGVVK